MLSHGRMAMAAPVDPNTKTKEPIVSPTTRRPMKFYHTEEEQGAPICGRHWMDAVDSEGWEQAGATGIMLAHVRKLSRGNQQDSTGNDE